MAASLQDVLARLPSNRKAGGGYVARCPAHDDKHASLSVTSGERVAVLLSCKAGCDFEAVSSALGFAKGELTRDDPQTETPRSRRHVAEYVYRNHDGSVFAQKDRWIDEGGRKTFVWSRPNPAVSGDWLSGTDGYIPLYRLPELCGAPQDQIVVICEGEKDANKLASLGFVVTTTPNGAASKWRADDSRFFAARRVCIIADDDEPGLKMAERFVSALKSTAKSVGFVTMPNPNEIKGFDASDFLESGGAISELTAIVDGFDKPKIPAEVVSSADLMGRVLKLWEEGDHPGIFPGWDVLRELYRPRAGELTIITGAPGAGKALALNTPLPTPSGWTLMGDVAVGDTLIDESGAPCRVVRATEVMMDRPCYRVVFSDGTVIVADEDHQWLTRDNQAKVSEHHARRIGRYEPRQLKKRGNDQSGKRTWPSVKTTLQISETIYADRGSRYNHAVPVSGAIILPEADLPIDPYVLGAWLGDGTAAAAQITTMDYQIVEEIERAGIGTKISPSHSSGGLASTYTLGVAGYRKSRTQESLQAKLRSLGVLNNKHIPIAYRRASIKQRLALLQGLMDTDGYVSSKGRCEFTNTNETLAMHARELAASLGLTPLMHTGTATLYGKNCGPKYRVEFTPGVQVFRLRRKAVIVESMLGSGRNRSAARYRRIIKCDKTASVPVRCIEVDSPSHLYLASEAFIPTHNSNFLDDMMVRISLGDQSFLGEVNAGWKWLIYSPENFPPQRHAAALLRKFIGKPFNRGPNPRISAEEIHTFWSLIEKHFMILDPSFNGCNLDRILEVARIVNQAKGIDGLVIDPYNVVAATSRSKTQSEHDFVNEALQKIKLFARSENVHVMMVAHPTKLKRESSDSEYPVPRPWDISGSAAFFNHPDAIISLWRSLLKEDRINSGEVEIHSQKIRFQPECGSLGMAVLYFDRVTTRFMEQPREGFARITADPKPEPKSGRLFGGNRS